MAYKPFGDKLNLDKDGQETETAPYTNRGYTGHEHIQETNLIHMNGRVYDPTIGRFLSADLLIPDPYRTQDFNRYSYVINNPLKYVDPSGHAEVTLPTIEVISTPIYDDWFDDWATDELFLEFWYQDEQYYYDTYIDIPVDQREIQNLSSKTTKVSLNFKTINPIVTPVPTYDTESAWDRSQDWGPTVEAQEALSMMQTAVLDDPSLEDASLDFAFALVGKLFSAFKWGNSGGNIVGGGIKTVKNIPTRFINGVKVTDRKTGNILEGTVDLKPTFDRINRGEKFQHRHDGSIFKNREGRLNEKTRGYYEEFVHPTPGVNGPGPQRVIKGQNGEFYYTPDHYETFIPLN